MAYNSKNLNFIVPRMGLGTSDTGDAGLGSALLTYRTDDANAAIVTSGYVTDAKAKGLVVGDQVLAIIDEDGTPALAHYRVSAVNATTGVGTLTA